MMQKNYRCNLALIIIAILSVYKAVILFQQAPEYMTESHCREEFQTTGKILPACKTLFNNSLQ
jgi:hypothetical protein